MDNGHEQTELSRQQLQLIVDALASAGASSQCFRCGNETQTVHNALANLNTQATISGLVLGGPSIPAAITFCNRCGVISLHALGVLGLLNHPAFNDAFVTP